jgi:hypothetical protein
MTSSGMLRRIALVITDVSEELSASNITVTRIGEIGTEPLLATEARCEEIPTKTWYFFAECVGC